jgi:signal transduction histidine kinase
MAKLAALLIERERLQLAREEAWIRVRAAQEVMQQMDEFLGIASHELKTPLTTLQGNIQLAKRQLARLRTPEGDGTQALTQLPSLLDRAERQIKVQNRLINDLLDVSRIHANRLELAPALVNLAQLVQETVEDQRNLVPTRPLHVETSPLEVLVFADAERVGQVVNNYLPNALKYSEASRPIEVRVTQTGKMARVEVTDEGPGLSAEQQEHIWQRFYRVPGIEVKSGTGVGLGLGLHICRIIIERQAGQVGVESTQGRRSTFWFTLPLADPSQSNVQ